MKVSTTIIKAFKMQTGELYYNDLLETFENVEYALKKLLNSDLPEELKAYRLKAFILNWININQLLKDIDE